MKRTITILPAALLLAAAAAAMPPRPGVTPPAALIEAIAAGRIDNPAQGLLADQMAKGGPAKISGSRSYPVVLGYFSDSGSTYSQAQFQAMLFSSGAGVKSVNNYYRDMSFSAMSCSGSVASWYTSGHTVAYYGGGNNGLNPGTTGNAYEFIRSVLAQADAAVDFSRPEYDLNNDGYVDVVWVVHAGRGGEEEPDANHNWIWSHSSSLNGWGGGATYYTTNDPWPGHTGQYVKINKYIIMPEKTLYSGESNAMIGCGVFAHEFGHALGLVDLYDVAVTSSSTVPGYGMGLYSLMAAGSWGGDYSSGARPVALDLWSRRFLGWCSPQLVSANGAYTVNATLATASSSSFKLAKQGQDTTGQFWLVENRCKNAQGTFSGVRWDSLLYGQGLAIYHVDMAYADTASSFFKSNHVNSNSTSGTTRNRPYGVALEETDDTTADYTSGLWWGLGAPGDAADLWNSSTQGSFDSTGTNYPTSLLNDGITRSGISITGIPAASAAMACVFNVFLTMPELNIGLLQNPAFSYSLGISMVSNHRLLSPDNLDTANLIFNGGAPQRLNFIHPTASTFQAGYTLQTTGSYVIRIASRDSDSTMVYRSGQRSFTVIAAKAAGGAIAALDGALGLRLAAGSVGSDMLWLVCEERGLPGAAAEAVSPAYRVGPDRYRLGAGVDLSLRYDAAALGGRDPSQLGIWSYNDGQWQYLGGRLDAASQRVTAGIQALGVFQLCWSDRYPALQAVTASPALSASPNPFAAATTIRYQLALPGRVSIAVYNAAGQLVRTLCDQVQPAGTHTACWDGSDGAGRAVSSGVYYYRLQAGGRSATGRMVKVQ